MLRYIPPALVHDAWPLILPGLLKVQAHSAEPDMAEQVMPALQNNSAWLYVIYAPDYRGFVVLKPDILANGRRNMHVWLAYSEKADFWGCYDEVEELARAFDATSITLSSPRKGWLRRMKGFKPVYVVYQKVLE